MLLEIGGRSAKLNQVRDACRGVKGYPIIELGVVPKRTVCQNSLKVTTQYRLGFGVLGVRNRLRDVRGVADVRGAECSKQNLECLIAW